MSESNGKLSPGLRRDAELVAAVCMSVEPDDVVTIITDDDHLDEANALAQVVVERGGYPVIANNEHQVQRAIADSREEAQAGIDAYISQYYPELSKAMDIGEWGPVGTPDDIADWLRTFADAGVDYFICRFGSLDQFGQVERLARDVLPAFETIGVTAPARATV